jgi:voltage-gated potassium channel Kch
VAGYLVTTLLLSAVGLALNALALRDIFRTLFAPTGTGALSSFAARHVWRAFRRVERHRPHALALAGPVALLGIIALWALALSVGWALLMWPHLPHGFHFAAGLEAARHAGFADALYLSLVTMVTLGYGDIVPHTTWLRLLVPLEALIGFALVTASISWILSLYPVLARRRHLAREVFLLGRSERRTGIALSGSDGPALAGVLLSLTEQVIGLRNDLAQLPIIYYFHTPDRGSAVEVALLDLAAVARTAHRHEAAAVRFQAALLSEALADYATHVTETFLDRKQERLEAMLAAAAADHGHRIERDVRDAEVTGEVHAER